MLRMLRCAGLVAGLIATASSVRADELTDIRALNLRGEYAAALTRAEAAVTAAPKEAAPRFQKAVALMGLQRDDEAMKAFVDLTQEYPELPDPWNDIALLQARAGRLDAARTALLTALRNDPGHKAARANLGQIYQMLAVEAWTRAAAESPLDHALERNLAAARAVLAPATAAQAASAAIPGLGGPSEVMERPAGEQRLK